MMTALFVFVFRTGHPVMSIMIQLSKELSLDFDQERRMAFWDSMRSWFIDRGYTPYERLCEDGWPIELSIPSSNDTSAPSEFPYAYQDRTWDPNIKYQDDYRGLCICAQDRQGRHIVLKVVKDGTEEYRVLRFLYNYTRENPPKFETFNHVIPVLDLIQLEDYWFAVMPRWGEHPSLPYFETVGDVLHLIHSLLKGLVFLHSQKIAHGDISFGNVLLNHIASDQTLNVNMSDRWKFRARGLITYAFFDFDCSKTFPLDSTPEQCRLPYTRSWRYTPGCIPPDTMQGEHDFDPFAWDVGALGVVICAFYQHLTYNVPMLAPLLDRMTTWDVPQRFTAPQALQFFEQIYTGLTEQDLSAKPVDIHVHEKLPYDKYDRWKRLDPAFVKKWSHYRSPPLPWTMKFMRLLCRYAWSMHAIAWIRWSFAVVQRKIRCSSTLIQMYAVRGLQRLRWT